MHHPPTFASLISENVERPSLVSVNFRFASFQKGPHQRMVALSCVSMVSHHKEKSADELSGRGESESDCQPDSGLCCISQFCIGNFNDERLQEYPPIAASTASLHGQIELEDPLQ